MVRSVNRAIRVLFEVADAGKPAALGEISTAAAVDKATTLRLLGTLEENRLISRDDVTKKYVLGPAVWRLARAFKGDLRAISDPYLNMLRDETQETTAIILRRGMDRIVLESKEPPQDLRVVAGINSVTPVYSGASGRVFMAWMADAERDYIMNATELKPVTVHGATQPKTYLAELKTVREQGYSSTISDVTIGATAIAAPIFDQSGDVHAVLSLRGPNDRLPPDRVKSIAPRLIEIAGAISSDLFGAAQGEAKG